MCSVRYIGVYLGWSLTRELEGPGGRRPKVSYSWLGTASLYVLWVRGGPIAWQ